MSQIRCILKIKSRATGLYCVIFDAFQGENVECFREVSRRVEWDCVSKRLWSQFFTHMSSYNIQAGPRSSKKN